MRFPASHVARLRRLNERAMTLTADVQVENRSARPITWDTVDAGVPCRLKLNGTPTDFLRGDRKDQTQQYILSVAVDNTSITPTSRVVVHGTLPSGVAFTATLAVVSELAPRTIATARRFVVTTAGVQGAQGIVPAP